MRLEFHQLDRRWERLRACHPARQQRLLASLAESGQPTPLVVVAAEDRPNRYVVIDGYKRIVGWLLAELERRFGYGLEELARRFDRSVSWVSRRLALVEVLPEAIQEQVRQGQIPAQVALKFLAPVARQSLEDCQRMADIFSQRHSKVREAGLLYAAWRQGSRAVRKRLLETRELFFKTQRQQSNPAHTELLRDLEMATAIVNRAQRRLAGAAELDGRQRESARRQIERMQRQLQRMSEQLEGEQETHVEPKSTHDDSGTGRPGSRQAGDRAGAGREPDLGAPAAARLFGGSARTGSWGEGGALPRQQILDLLHECQGNLVRVHEELVAGGAALSYQALTAFCRRHGIGQPPAAPAGRYEFSPGEEMQHDTSPHEVRLGGKKRKVQTASAVLCYSRMLFFQCYPTFQRFDCKVFLTDALRYFCLANQASRFFKAPAATQPGRSGTCAL